MKNTRSGGSMPQKDLRHLVQQTFPILEWLPKYTEPVGPSGDENKSSTSLPQAESWVSSKLLPDLSGSVLLGCILEAQSLAHAGLSGVDLINGPYSCILPPIFYVIFGTSVHSSVGTGGLVSLLTGEQLARIGETIEDRTHACAILTLEVGLLLAVMGMLNLGALVRFISKPVLSGFVTASAILIMLSQLAPMLGLPEAEVKGGIVHIVLHHIEYLTHTNIATLLLSLVAITWLMNAKKFKSIKKVPALKYLSDFKELLLLVLGAIACSHYNAKREPHKRISVVGDVPLGLPALSFPLQTASDIELAKQLLPAAVLVGLVVFISSFAGAKKFGLLDGYQVRAFNELLGLGFANIGGAFMGAVPTQIGLSRMGIARQAGIKTQLGANLFVGIVVALITMFFSQYLYNVPRCLLNAIIVNGASHLTEFDEAKRLYAFAKVKDYSRKMRAELMVWITGLVATLWLGALKGMIVAVLVSILLILAQVSDPTITALGYDPKTVDHHVEEHPGEKPRPRKWVDRSRRVGIHEESGILVFRLEGPLFYANSDSLQEWLEEEEVNMQLKQSDQEGGYAGIIFSAGAVSFMDTTAVEALKKIIKSYKARKIPFFFANTFGQVGRLITRELEPLMKEGLGEVAEKVHGSSSIDDFILLIKEYIVKVRDADKSPRRRSFIPLKRCGTATGLGPTTSEQSTA